MLLEGSCHCGAVHFSVESHTPYPYMRCYCSICRKTAGTGGFAINIMGDNDSMAVSGRRHVREYRADFDGVPSEHRRYFCRRCGSALWAWHPAWPELVHPFAGAIDTPLPKPKEFVDLMLGSAAPWVELHRGKHIERFDVYPDESIEDWHRNRGLWLDD
jgi:hypothetical protein